MPHAGVHAIFARQNKIDKRRVGVLVFLQVCAGSAADICAIYPACRMPSPAIANHCNPRRWRRYYISLCHVTILGISLGIDRLGVAWRCSALTADANLDADNHNMQQQLQQVQMVLGAGGSRWLRVVAAVCDRCGWTKPPHHTI